MQTFLEIDEVYGLYTDSILTDGGDLVFGSFWGHDTAVREFQARLTLGKSDVSGLTSFTVLNVNDLNREALNIRVNIDRLTQKTGRVQTDILGSLVHCFIYRNEITQPDLANSQAIVIGKDAEPENIWNTVVAVCPIPLLEKWQHYLISKLVSSGMITSLTGVNHYGSKINLCEESMAAIIKKGCCDGSLTI